MTWRFELDPSAPGPGGLAAFLAGSSVKAALLLAAAGLASLALRRGSAASRHLAWSLAAAGALGLPALSAVLPGWRVPLAAPWAADDRPPAADLTRHEPLGAVPGEVALVAQLADGRREAAARPQSPGPVLGTTSQPVSLTEPSEVPLIGHDLSTAVGVSLALWAWAAGVCVFSAPVWLGLLSLRRLARGSEPVTDEATLALARRLSARIGLRRPVRLVLSPGREVPMTWGVLRPVVLLPRDALAWTEERLATALAHELAHVKRWDCLSHLVARLACAGYWFNPLAWLALARVRGEQEQACDDLALGCGLDRVSYAGNLLAILAGRPAGSPRASLAPAMGSSGKAKAKLERRLVGILDEGRPRRPPGRRAVGLASAAAALAVLPLAALSPGAGAEAKSLAAAPEADDPKPSDGSGSVEDVLARVRETAVKAPDESALRDGAIKGLLDALHDPYSAYYDSQQMGAMERALGGKVSGIGVQLNLEDGKVTVITPLPDSPAIKAGLRPGDVIEEVDGQPTRGKELSEVVKQILGEEGKPVRLKVRHADGRADDLSVTRAAIKLRSVRGFRLSGGRWDFLLDPAHGIGYAQVSQFGPDTAAELKEALGGLKARGLKGLILDLRGSPGGLMNAAVETAGLFLSRGTILTVRGRDQAARAIKAEGPAEAPDVPLVVLADGSTASAAEIVTGALKDNDRAVVVGSRTFGKGSVQTIIKLKEGGGAIRLTSAYYELPSGANIDRRGGQGSWGVDPTDGYYVPVDARTAEALTRKRLEREKLGGPEPAAADGAKVTPESIERDESDPPLAAALKTLIARTTQGAFVKTGLPVAEQSARLRRLDEARKRRQSLVDDLKKVEKELSELDR
jgi:carboxyl-terminal processing protease